MSGSAGFIVPRFVERARVAFPMGCALAGGFGLGAVWALIRFPLAPGLIVATLCATLSLRSAGQAMSVRRFAWSSQPIVRLDAESVAAFDLPGSIGRIKRTDVDHVATASVKSAEIVSIVVKAEATKNGSMPRHLYDRRLLRYNRSRRLGDITIGETQTSEPLAGLVARMQSSWPEVAVVSVGDVSPRNVMDVLRGF